MNLLWEQAGWIGLDAATCAIGDASRIAPDHRLDLRTLDRTEAMVSDLTGEDYPAVILKTGADLELPVEIARGTSGEVEAVRMELVEDVAEIDGTWAAVATLDLRAGSLMASDPFGLGPHRRIDLRVRPGEWRIEAFHPDVSEDVGPLGLRALWTRPVVPTGPKPTLEELCRAHDAWVDEDNDFQHRARLLQSLWRADQGLDPGSRPGHGDLLLGSRLTDEDAAAGRNLLTPYLHALAVAEAAQAGAAANPRTRKLIDRDRLLGNLLSSQPLCFNLFGELAADLHLAGRVLRRLWPDDVDEVVGITFEESPGRKDARYLDNRSAADVLIRHTTPAGGMGFVAIETKYHEDLSGPNHKLKPRYEQVAAESGAFVAAGPKVPNVRKGRLQQLWLDHLLALSMLQAGDGWASGRFVLVHPERNVACAKAAAKYRQALTTEGLRTFDVVTLEAVHAAIRAETDAAWVADLSHRYLDFDRIDQSTAPG